MGIAFAALLKKSSFITLLTYFFVLFAAFAIALVDFLHVAFDVKCCDGSRNYDSHERNCSIALVTKARREGCSVQKNWRSWLLVFPNMALARAFRLIGIPRDFMDHDQWSEFSGCILMLVAVGTLLCIIGSFFLFFAGDELSPLQKCWEKYQTKQSQEEDGGVVVLHEEDDDVRREKDGMAQNQADPIFVQGVSKQYRGGKKAVNKLSFSVKAGECFGLLGPNGAGKTSVISMISCASIVTNGILRVMGIDVMDKPSEALCHVAVVPQFDFFDSNLNVEDILLFYGRLKGVARSRERFVARLIAERVGLDGDSFLTKSSALSSGQSRRLTIAVALVSNPPVLLLDEPGTGVDVHSRREIWDIIAKVQKNKAVLLTTHSMEEADTLAQRIGVMASGSLRCLGTPLHLKKKFGSGYRLEVVSDDEGAVCGFVKKMWPGADLCSDGERKLMRFSLPEHAKLSDIFEEIEKNRHSLEILQWCCGEVDLNEVFIRIAEEDIARNRRPLEVAPELIGVESC